MSEAEQELKKSFSRYFTAFCLSKAILEDYVQVVSKLEGTTPEEVKNRIDKRMHEISDTLKAEEKS